MITPNATTPIHTVCDYKGWWYDVWVSSTRLNWPQRCACCLKAREAYVTLTHNGAKFGYPICARCRRHGAMDFAAGLLAIGAGLVSMLPIHWQVWGLHIPVGWAFVALVDTGIFLVLAASIYAALRFALCRKTAACADQSYPVDTLGEPFDQSLDKKQSERSDDYQLRVLHLQTMPQLGPQGLRLRFTNKQYLEEFLTANGASPAAMIRIDAQG